MSDAALNVAATYANLRDDIARGTSIATDFSHAVRLAQFMDDAIISSEAGVRRKLGDWPLA